VSLTVTNYLSRINREFPVRGQDNDSQGFRDNWKNIYEAIDQVNTEIDELNLYAIKTNNVATFYGNTFEDVNFKNQSIELYNLDTQTEAIEIDYTLGSYQKFEVTAGRHDLTVNNWPGAGKSGKITLSITALSNAYTAINFNSSYVNLNPQSNPFELTTSKPNIFELWCEEGSDTVFVRYLTAFTYDTSSTTSTLWANQFRIGELNNVGESNRYYTATNKATVVQRGNEFGELGLVPNRIDKILRAGTESTGPSSVIQLQFDTVSDLVPGAFFYSTLTNTMYTVTTVLNTNTVAIAPNDIDVGDLTANVDSFKFTNPTFTDQPTLLTLIPNSANTSTGSKSNFIGSVYANKHRLEVTYDNFGSENTNTFAVQTLQTNTDVSYVNTDIVDTTFVHSLLPIGAVIMWYGKKTEIPYGWTLCDGSEVFTIINGTTSTTKVKTPDLSNRFVVGAIADKLSSIDGSFEGPGSTVTTSTTSTQGGNADTIVPAHSHVATFTGSALPAHEHTLTDPGHNHINGDFSYLLKPPYAGSLTGSDTTNSGSEQAVGAGDGGSIASADTGITVATASAGTPTGVVSVISTGTDVTGQNVPPFTALYYIMKISGYISTGSGIVTAY